MASNKSFYVYFITNKWKTTLYLGVTNNLKRRISEHRNGVNNGFSKKYRCYYLVYFESHSSVLKAIAREKEIKKWRREKKNALIASTNPKWLTLEP
jgi:putative endonuclease